MEPPIHAPYFLSSSGGAMTLTGMFGGARAVISFFILSANPGNNVFPPVSTILAYISFLKSELHFMMEL